MSMKLKSLVVLMGLSLGLVCLLQSTVAYGAGTTENKYQIMAGDWEIKTVGTRKGCGSQGPEVLTQTIILNFVSGKQKQLQITGSPFGFPLTTSDLKSAKKGGKIQFGTSYTIGGGSYGIKWEGKLSQDGTKITDGKFDFILGGGTFTAEKKEKGTAEPEVAK